MSMARGDCQHSQLSPGRILGGILSSSLLSRRCRASAASVEAQQPYREELSRDIRSHSSDSPGLVGAEVGFSESNFLGQLAEDMDVNNLRTSSSLMMIY